jgi:hypothetical protein
VAYSISVDWRTAQVTPAGDTLGLAVDLDAEPDDFWCDAFDKQRGRANSNTLRQHDWRYSSVSGRRVTVLAVRPDLWGELRDELNTLVVQANADADQLRQHAEQDMAGREAAAERRAREAEEMTRRLRGD